MNCGILQENLPFNMVAGLGCLFYISSHVEQNHTFNIRREGDDLGGGVRGRSRIKWKD